MGGGGGLVATRSQGHILALRAALLGMAPYAGHSDEASLQQVSWRRTQQISLRS